MPFRTFYRWEVCLSGLFKGEKCAFSDYLKMGSVLSELYKGGKCACPDFIKVGSVPVRTI